MNIKELSDIHGLTVEEFSEIIRIFIDTAKADIEKIRAAAEKGDALSVSQAAHSLKGAAGNLGFKKISEVAQAVEIDAEKNELEKITSSLPFLTDQLKYITAQLKAGI